MNFEEVKQQIEDFRNTKQWDFSLANIDFSNCLAAVDKLVQTVEEQMQKDIVIYEDNPDLEFLERQLTDFFDMMIPKNLLEYTLDTTRRFCLAVSLLVSNWITLLDKDSEKLQEFARKLRSKADQLRQIVTAYYSFLDLIELQKMQAQNLQRWNTFRPAGFDLAKHYLDVLFEKFKQEDGDCR